MGNKETGFLGETDVNLSDYHEGKYNMMRLTLSRCHDPDAYVEIGIRGTMAPDSTAHKEMPDKTGGEEEPASFEDIEKLKRELKKLTQEQDKKLQTWTEKVNNLGTALENTKTELSHQQRLNKQEADDKIAMTAGLEIIQQKIEMKGDGILEFEKDVDY